MVWIDAVKKAEIIVGTLPYERSLFQHIYPVTLFSPLSILSICTALAILFLAGLKKIVLFLVGYFRRRLESTQKLVEPIPIVGFFTGLFITNYN